MADDRRYVPGDNYLLDDISGMKIRSSRAKVIPGGITGGLAVAPERWEPQNAQDFVVGVRDDQTVDLSRPRQRNQFVVLGTWVTAQSLRLSYEITIADPVGFAAGTTLLIMLDSGVQFETLLVSVSGNVFTLLSPLPASVGGNIGNPIENSVIGLEQTPFGTVVILGVTGSDILGVNTLA